MPPKQQKGSVACQACVRGRIAAVATRAEDELGTGDGDPDIDPPGIRRGRAARAAAPPAAGAVAPRRVGPGVRECPRRPLQTEPPSRPPARQPRPARPLGTAQETPDGHPPSPELAGRGSGCPVRAARRGRDHGRRARCHEGRVHLARYRSAVDVGRERVTSVIASLSQFTTVCGVAPVRQGAYGGCQPALGGVPG
jgi:hypothetical protein